MNTKNQSMDCQIIKILMNYAKNKSMKFLHEIFHQFAKKNTKKRRSADKRQRNLKVNLEPLEAGEKSCSVIRQMGEGPRKIQSLFEINDILHNRKERRRWTSI